MKEAAQKRHSGACIYSYFRQPLETIFSNLHYEFPHTHPELAEGTYADAVPARSRHGGICSIRGGTLARDSPSSYRFSQKLADLCVSNLLPCLAIQIGRASCRERV